MEKILITDASVAEALRKQMAEATSGAKGLMSAADKNKTTTWYANTPGGPDMKSLRISTNISKPVYSSYFIYLNLGQCYNRLWNEIFYINLGVALSAFKDRTCIKLGSSSFVKNIIARFDETSQLQIVVNFTSAINNYAGVSEISIVDRGTPAIVTPLFSTEEYTQQSDEIVMYSI